MTQIPSNIKLVIWDFDGTLIDSFGLYKKLVTQFAPDFNQPVPSAETFAANYHGSLDESITNVFEGKLTPEQVHDFVARFLSVQDGEYADAEMHILKDAAELCRKLTKRGVMQAIVTNRSHEGRGSASPRSIVERSSLSDHIDHIICGDDSEFKKPDTKVPQSLLSNLKVLPEEILVIGDQHVDAQLALNLECNGIIVERGDEKFASHHLTNKNWKDHIAIVSSLEEVHA